MLQDRFERARQDVKNFGKVAINFFIKLLRQLSLASCGRDEISVLKSCLVSCKMCLLLLVKVIGESGTVMPSERQLIG